MAASGSIRATKWSAALARLREPCEFRSPLLQGPIRDLLERPFGRLNCYVAKLQTDKFQLNPKSPTYDADQLEFESAVDDVNLLVNRSRQLRAFTPLSRSEADELVRLTAPTVVQRGEAPLVVDLILYEGGAQAFLNASLGLGKMGVRTAEAKRPESAEEVRLWFSSSRNASEVIWPVGKRPVDLADVKPPPSITLAEAEKVRREIEEVLKVLKTADENAPVASKSKASKSNKGQGKKSQRSDEDKQDSRTDDGEGEEEGDSGVPLVLEVILMGGHRQGKDGGWDIDVLIIIDRTYQGDRHESGGVCDDKSLRGNAERILTVLDRMLTGAISHEEDPDRTYVRKASWFSKSATKRETNFAGAFGARLGFRLSESHTTSVDVAVALRNTAGCTSVTWSSAPSFTDSLQRRAHSLGYHLTPVALFRADKIGLPEGVVDTPTEESLFRALQLPYTPPTERHSDGSRQLHLTADGRYIERKEYRAGGFYGSTSAPFTSAAPSPPVLKKTEDQVILDDLVAQMATLGHAPPKDAPTRQRAAKKAAASAPPPKTLAPSASGPTAPAPSAPATPSPDLPPPRPLKRIKLSERGLFARPGQAPSSPRTLSTPPPAASTPSPNRARSTSSPPTTPRKRHQPQSTTTGSSVRSGPPSSSAPIATPSSSLQSLSPTSVQKQQSADFSDWIRTLPSDFEYVCPLTGIRLDQHSISSARDGQYLTFDLLEWLLKVRLGPGYRVAFPTSMGPATMAAAPSDFAMTLRIPELFESDLAFLPLHRGHPEHGHFFLAVILRPRNILVNPALLPPHCRPALLVCDSCPLTNSGAYVEVPDPQNPRTTVSQFQSTPWTPQDAVERVGELLAAEVVRRGWQRVARADLLAWLDVYPLAAVPTQSSDPDCAFFVEHVVRTFLRDPGAAEYHARRCAYIGPGSVRHDQDWASVWQPHLPLQLRGLLRQDLLAVLSP